MQRLQLKIVSSFLYGIHQGQIDPDSATQMAAQGEHLNPALFYDEAYNDGSSPLPGANLIAAGSLDKAIALLPALKADHRIQLLLALGGHYTFRPANSKADLDKAHRFLQQASTAADSIHSQKWKNASLTMLGEYYTQTGDLAKSSTCFSTVVGTARQSGSRPALAQALADKGTFAPLQDTGKLTQLNTALHLFKEQKDTIKEIEMLTRIFEVYGALGNIDTLRIGLLRIMDLEKAIGFRELHYYYNVLSYIDMHTGKISDAFTNSLESIRRMQISRDTAFAPLFYLRMGQIFLYYYDIDESLSWYYRSMQQPRDAAHRSRLWYSTFVEETGTLLYFDRFQEALTLIQTTIAEYPPVTPLEKMFISTNRAICYKKLNMPALAETDFAASVKYAESLSNEPRVMQNVSTCYLAAAAFYAEKGQIDKALTYLHKSERIPYHDDIGTRSWNANVHYKIDSAQGSYASSLKYYQLLRQLDDSTYQSRRTKQLEALRIQYDIAKKDQNIQLQSKNIQFLTNQAQLQKVQVAKTTLTRNVMIAGTGMLLLLLAVLYNRYRLKQKNNLQLQEKQKEISGKNQALEKLLHENEWLLREVHHRVKNNLQIVMSLLNSQSAYLQDEAALNAVLESQHRVQAMSLIHQKLYKSNNVSSIYMPEYISDLVEYLKDSFRTKQSIYFKQQIDPIELDVLNAVPVGLILNEAITNALKYAFPHSDEDTIVIRLFRSSPDEISLIIADNGRGLPANFDIGKINTFGLLLIKGMSEDLDGHFSIEQNNGTVISMVFQIPTTGF